jgi:hypothetical protein
MDQSNGRSSRNKKTQSIDSDDRAVWNDLDQDIVSVDDFDRALAGLDLDETAIERDVANGNDLSRAAGSTAAQKAYTKVVKLASIWCSGTGRCNVPR